MKISKGLATWAGVVAAGGQYLAAVALFLGTLDGVDPLAGVAPLVTATGVLWKVIEGRMNQATALAAKAPTTTPVYLATTGTAGTASSSGTSLYVDGREFAKSLAVAGEAEEPGDPDALPDYQTETDPPPDEGDTSANGEGTP